MFWYASGFKYAKILNIAALSICERYTAFWICLDRFLNISRVLNMPGFWICHNMAGDDDDKLFCGMVDRRKAFSLISSWSHCQRILTISNLRRTASKIWTCAEPEFRLCWRHYGHISAGRISLDMSKWDVNMSECMITDRVLSMSHRIHSVWSLYKLLGTYWEIGVFRTLSNI